MSHHVVIHRGRTFEYRGHTYRIGQLAERWADLAFTIERVMSDAPGDFILVEDGFRTMRDIRAHLAESARMGRPLESEDVQARVDDRQRELDAQ